MDKPTKVIKDGLAPSGYRLHGDGELRVVRRWFGGSRFHISTAQATNAVFGVSPADPGAFLSAVSTG